VGCGLALGATAAEAQSGHPVLVVNVMTSDGRPVADALVRLRSAGRLTRTDWMGEARLMRVPRGRQQVQVARIGYAPAVVDLLVNADTTGAQFVLEQLTDTLAAVNVTARAPSMPAANLADFNRRKAMGIGRFLDDTVFERHAGQLLPLVLAQRFPGLRAESRGAHYAIISARGPTRFMQKGPCRVDVYMDGVPISANDRAPQDAIDHLSPQDLAGAELYSMESAPAQFRNGSRACHVLLLWTRW
jgi:hypothetical protein